MEAAKIFGILFNSSSNKDFVESKFTKQSQTEYIVLADSQKKKVILLSESYNKNWILPNVKNNIHFVANGYGNGWLVEDTNNVAIKYKPQDYVDEGMKVSLGSVLLFSLISSMYFIQKVIKR